MLAGLLTLFLLSLAGIPPTAGFIAKVRVFSAATRAGWWPLVLIGVLASVVAAFFYLAGRADGMQEPEGEDVADRLADAAARARGPRDARRLRSCWGSCPGADVGPRSWSRTRGVPADR